MNRLNFELLYVEQQVELVQNYGKLIRKQSIGRYFCEIYQYDSFVIVLFRIISDGDVIATSCFNNLGDIEQYAIEVSKWKK